MTFVETDKYYKSICNNTHMHYYNKLYYINFYVYFKYLKF